MAFEQTNTKRSEVITITPEMAGVMVRNNHHNRKISIAVKMAYARAMREGRWRLNGEPILIDTHGKLLDGQHRLYACIDSGVPITTWITYGVDPDTFATINTGKSRSAGDVLGMTYSDLGCDPKSVASTVRWICLLRSDWYSPNSIKMSNDEILAAIKSEPQISTSTAAAMIAKAILPPGLGGALHFLFAEKDREEADEFMRNLGLGTGLEENDPVLLLRERLQKAKTGKSRLKLQEVCTLTIRAWAHRRNNSFPKSLKGSVVYDGGRAGYPEIV